MQFRVPEGSTEEIRVALTTGHVVTLIPGENWRIVPAEFHSLLVAAGADFEKTRGDRKTIDPTAGDPKDKKSDDADPTYAAAIRAAITTMIDRREEGDFTGDGHPNTNVVASLAGVKVKKTDVLAIFEKMKLEAGVGAGDDAGGEGDPDGEEE